MPLPQLFQLHRQAVPQRALWPQLLEQLLGSIEHGQLDLARREHSTPTARDLILG
jgi:hypothetical protein